MKINLHQGDCLGLLKSIPDKSIDLIITDPPYGIGRDKGSAGFGVAKERIDNALSNKPQNASG